MKLPLLLILLFSPSTATAPEITQLGPSIVINGRGMRVHGSLTVAVPRSSCVVTVKKIDSVLGPGCTEAVSIQDFTYD